MRKRDGAQSGRTAAVGLLAWLAYALTIEAAAAVTTGLTMSFPAWVGSLLIGRIGLTAAWMGWTLLGAVTIGWAFLYRAVGPWLPGPVWLQGSLFGLLLWLLSAALILPAVAVANPLVVDRILPGPGLMGSTFGGTTGIAVSILAHLALGLTLAISLPVALGAATRER